MRICAISRSKVHVLDKEPVGASGGDGSRFVGVIRIGMDRAIGINPGGHRRHARPFGPIKSIAVLLITSDWLMAGEIDPRG